MLSLYAINIPATLPKTDLTLLGNSRLKIIPQYSEFIGNRRLSEGACVSTSHDPYIVSICWHPSTLDLSLYFIDIMSTSKLRSIIVSAGEIFHKRKPRANSLADINVDRASPTPLHSETHTSPHPRTCPPDLQRQEHARSASLDCSETGKALDTSPRARPEDSRSNASVVRQF